MRSAIARFEIHFCCVALRSAWWHQQAKDLYAITDDAENGMMSCMVTITHNDNCGEILANL